MFIGKYYHKVESKNRVSVPSKFREKLGIGAILTKGLDGCLALYDSEQWEGKIAEATRLAQTKRAHREYIRFLTNNAIEVEIDGQGRMHLTEDLKAAAKIDKQVVFVGTLDHIEVWDQDTYHTYIESVDSSIEDQVETIAVGGISST